MSDKKNTNNLKKIREDKGLTIAEVSSKLKLTSDTINKLEEGRFKELGAYTYVRGYLIHYTNLLQIEADPLLKLIPKAEFEVPLVNTSSHLKKGIKLSKQSKNMASYMLGTFLVIIISFSGWYLLKNYTGFSQSRLNREIVNNSSNDLIPPQQDEFAMDQQLSAEQRANDPNKEEAFHYSSLIPSNDENSLAQNNNETEVASDDKSELRAEENAEAVLSVYKIKVVAREISWVKVEEINGIKLHNDLLQPSTITLVSDKPLHFRIGNEKNVTISINDEIIDISKYSRKNIADFNWPQDG
jgi:cytoskeletal protein RodZ